MMLAEREYLVDNETASLNFEKAGSKIKDLIVYKGAYHELQKEPIKD